MAVMMSKETFPHLHLVVSTALEQGGCELMSKMVSGGPLTQQQLRQAEVWLHVKANKYRLEDEVVKCCQGEHGMLMLFSDAMEIMNGQNPEADVVLLVHMGMEGEL